MLREEHVLSSFAMLSYTLYTGMTVSDNELAYNEQHRRKSISDNKIHNALYAV